MVAQPDNVCKSLQLSPEVIFTSALVKRIVHYDALFADDATSKSDGYQVLVQATPKCRYPAALSFSSRQRVLRIVLVLRWLHENNHIQENSWLTVLGARDLMLKSAKFLDPQDRLALLSPFGTLDISRKTLDKDMLFWRDLCVDYNPMYGYRLPRAELGAITVLRGIGLQQASDGTIRLAVSPDVASRGLADVTEVTKAEPLPQQAHCLNGRERNTAVIERRVVNGTAYRLVNGAFVREATLQPKENPPDEARPPSPSPLRQNGHPSFYSQGQSLRHHTFPPLSRDERGVAPSVSPPSYSRVMDTPGVIASARYPDARPRPGEPLRAYHSVDQHRHGSSLNGAQRSANVPTGPRAAKVKPTLIRPAVQPVQLLRVTRSEDIVSTTCPPQPEPVTSGSTSDAPAAESQEADTNIDKEKKLKSKKTKRASSDAKEDRKRKAQSMPALPSQKRQRSPSVVSQEAVDETAFVLDKPKKNKKKKLKLIAEQMHDRSMDDDVTTEVELDTAEPAGKLDKRKKVKKPTKKARGTVTPSGDLIAFLRKANPHFFAIDGHATQALQFLQELGYDNETGLASLHGWLMTDPHNALAEIESAAQEKFAFLPMHMRMSLKALRSVVPMGV